MTPSLEALPGSLAARLDRFGAVEDRRDRRRILHPLPEAPRLVVCGAIADPVREGWPEKAGLVALDGKTSRRSHDRGAAFADSAYRG